MGWRSQSIAVMLLLMVACSLLFSNVERTELTTSWSGTAFDSLGLDKGFQKVSASAVVFGTGNDQRSFVSSSNAAEKESPKQRDTALSDATLVRYINTSYLRCSGCFMSMGVCSEDISSEVDYLPLSFANNHSLEKGLQARAVMQKVLERFDEWLCSLPASSIPATSWGTLSPEDCYEPESSSVFCERTVGKTLLRWDHTLLQLATGLDPLHGAGKFFAGLRLQIDLENDVSQWQWLPQRVQPNRWFHADFCRSKAILNTTSWTTSGEFKAALDNWVYAARFNRAGVGLYALLQGLALHTILRHHLAGSLKMQVERLLDKATVVGDASANYGCTIAMHVRRGDACIQWKSERGWSGGARPCFETSLYMTHLKRLQARYGTCEIRVATDDQSFVDKLPDLAQRTGWRFVFLPYARDLFKPPPSQFSSEQQTFIENRKWSMDEKNAITYTFLADLLFLSNADLLLGTASSTVTRLLHLLITASAGALPPYISLDRPFENYLNPESGTCEYRQWI
mmetsp:Transcript_2589/g.6030  ORF Transcript_2589/g.6030 Transcript_2589/m.6030 type:complete len:512 (+) Transcript_2589:150-1685(+)|eukprot:CAMPEP_0171547538 /NCGR_PEP_ID=MMETSP0960-20121227/5267_1 /TAXON_ID=87120 /ORGANISM="Aurantiochytrium limacinum, Strain ATCCMYA-1381" /LENGTH=511 /DNA_ID=CAMNT_0012095779 /DNA_START=62 /DNA_END=1597 /DNA_ORIENTATION=-